MKLNHSYSAFSQFQKCPQSYYRQRIAKDVPYVQGKEAAEGDRQHKAFELRMKHGKPLPSDLAHLEVLAKGIEVAMRGASAYPEKEMVINKELVPTGWWDEDAWFRSKADLLLLSSGDRRGVIFDWKTGKRRPDPLQMQMMALAAFIHYPKLQSVDTMFVWFKDKAIDAMVYRRSDMPKLVETLLQNVQRIERALELERWPAKPSPLCNWCAAQPTCEWGK